MDKQNPTRQDISDLYDEADTLCSRWLENRGWKYTSANPTSCWYWERTIGGVRYRLQRGDAMELESRMSGCPDCGSDEIAYENPRTGAGTRVCQGCGYEFPHDEANKGICERKDE